MSIHCVNVAATCLMLIIAANVLAWGVYVGAREIWRRFRRLSPASKAVAVVIVGGMTWFAGGKHVIGTITFPFTDIATRYLVNAGSYVTNDFVHVSFTRNPLVPSTASFYLDACPVSVTNISDIAANSFNVYSNTFNNFAVPIDVPYAAATNYNWFAYTDWTPSPTVHTNGVAFVLWRQKATNELEAIVVPYRTGIYRDSMRISPNPSITNGPPIHIIRGAKNNKEEE